jgi:hypothetical protein
MLTLNAPAKIHGEAMKIYGDIDFQSSNSIIDAKITLAIESGYPEIPVAGRLIFVGKRVLICVELVQGVPIWIPLTGVISSYIHTQTQYSTVWTINHEFNTNSVFVQCMDQDGRTIIPDEVDLSVTNVVTVHFNSPIIGRAILMLGSLLGLPKENVLFTQSFTDSDTWVISHGLGYNPVIRCFIGQYEVQPHTIVHNSTTMATVTFTSPQTGSVSCF